MASPSPDFFAGLPNFIATNMIFLMNFPKKATKLGKTDHSLIKGKLYGMKVGPFLNR